MLATILLRHDLTPVCAGDGKTGLELLARQEFAAIMLDFLLPVLDGFEVLRRLDPRLLHRVIVMTAAHESLWRDCPYLERIHRLVRKPFDLDELEREVVTCCRK